MKLEKIIDAKDKAREENYNSIRERIEQLAIAHNYRVAITSVDKSCPVLAVVNYGRWIAQCECGGAEYVALSDPVFFCCSCGNASVDGKLRMVIFPSIEEIQQIEAEILKVEIDAEQKIGFPLSQLVLTAKSEKLRNWEPKSKDEEVIETEKK